MNELRFLISRPDAGPVVSGERVKVNHIHNNNTSLKEDNKFPITKTTSYI